MTDYVEVYVREDAHPEDPPEFDWRRKVGENHQVIATSGGQGYRDLDFCLKMAMRVNGPDVLYRIVHEGGGYDPVDFRPESHG